MSTSKRTKRDLLPIVVVQRARCPKCGGADLVTKRSVANSDGSSTRYTHCANADCGAKFIVVLE